METTTLFSTGQIIDERKLPIAQGTTNLHFQLHPELEKKYGKAGIEKCTEDSLFHLSYLAEAVRSESSEIFTSYLEWAQLMLQSRNLPCQLLIENLGCMDTVCRQLLTGDDYQVISVYLNEGIHRLKKTNPSPATSLKEDNPLLLYAKQYLSLLLKGDRRKAQSLILGLVKDNQPVAVIYEHIFQPSQVEVGLLWQTNKITVAHEHYCTAATQLIMASLYPYIFDSPRKGAKLLACTISGDLHEIGIRMVSDFFEMGGWDTYYLGANMPEANIISAIREQRADLLAISVTMPFHISKAQNLITSIRNDEEIGLVKIMVGGFPFNLVPGLWGRVGADGFAGNAKDAIALANQMIFHNKNLLE